MYVLTGIRQLETCPHSCFDVVARKQELYGWVWRAGLTLQGLTWTVTYSHSQVVEWLVQQQPLMSVGIAVPAAEPLTWPCWVRTLPVCPCCI